ncbi:exported hypothetical protein [Acidobacteriia bacterium SbA2]|nr:exported hypothetical protein [Acidobacteriia bacterium SbA2]
MGRSLSNALRLAVAIICLWSLGGCGKTTKPGPPNFPGRINLIPSSNTSVVLGSTFNFTASVQTASGGNVNTPVTFTSSDTSVLTLAPNGVACAGHWDVAFTTCIPGGTGLATVTASALGASSIPTYVFVHPPIDTITVTGVLLNGIPVQEPCLSQSQSMTVEAHAFSQGTDITSSVGPFTWSANNLPVVNLIPLVNNAYNFPTNQATAKASSPGFTQIYASASGVTSSSFLQPQYQNSQGTTSPPLDFFETCPIQSISLEVGVTGTQQTGQTTFVTSKGLSQNATAVLTDVMGSSSLPNTNGAVILSRIPLTWSASQPGVLSTASGCFNSCNLSTPLPGSGSVTASCSPPSCNIGFPVVPASLSTDALVTSCTDFFHAQYPQLISCQQLIPVPVYASPLPPNLIASSCVLGPDTDCPGVGAISGVITGATTGTSVLATSTGCAHEPPVTCSASIYNLSTSKAATGPENPLPVPPNSLLFDLTGDRAYMGSDFGAQIVSPANLGSNNNPFTPLGTVTGNVLAASVNGSAAVFSDTIHTPNQVYVVNAGSTSALSANALNISQAVTAAFTPDGLKTFIVGNSGNSLYIYSTLQALQGPIALTGPANAIGFSPNGAFAFVAQQAPSPTGFANLSAFSTCNNQLAANLPLPANPLFMRVLPGVHIDGTDSSGSLIPDGIHVLVLDATGFDVITSTISPPASGTLCPQTLTFKPPQRIELGQGKLQPVNFFVSADGSQLYIASTSNASILVYGFNSGAVTGILLQGNATPLGADMSADAGTILVAGSDGMLHEVSTALGGFDQFQITFPSLPNYLNPFCTFTPTQGACTLNTVLARP